MHSFASALMASLAFILTTEAAISGFLDIDNIPCRAEVLKATNRYICDAKGDVICQSGWRDVLGEVDPLNRCAMPICPDGCDHGECRAPNICSCEVGWEGPRCDICVPLPGCEHGTCDLAFECNCDGQYSGAYCNMPICTNCQNGDCVSPGNCLCHDGWYGLNCTSCRTLPGCLNGHCDNGEPNTCKCSEGWTGHLCDQPLCDPVCVHGVCHYVEGDQPNICLCKPGWQGDQCNQCVPYWACPYNGTDACVKPFECRCPANFTGDMKLCNSALLLQDQHGSRQNREMPSSNTLALDPENDSGFGSETNGAVGYENIAVLGGDLVPTSDNELV